MATAVSGLLTVTAKNRMLERYATPSSGESYRIGAYTGSTLESDEIVVTFGTPSNGKVSITSSVNLTVNSLGSGEISKLMLRLVTPGVSSDQINYFLAEGLEFPDGGTLTVNSLEIELEDE
jgi:hypothetical protein